jgi:RNA polymerase primary sigma factor
VPDQRPPSKAEKAAAAALQQQARSHGKLSPEQETELLGQRPGREAVEALVKHNLDLVVDQAASHAGEALPFGDLYQEGALGLLDAVVAYDGQGAFRDFASLHIGLQMDSLVEGEAGARREEEAVAADVERLELVQGLFQRERRRPATAAELAQTLGWDEERLAKASLMLELARARNDALTVEFLDDSNSEELGVDFPEPERDPRRRPKGAGPDE